MIIVLSFIEVKQPNLAELCRLRERIKPVNFVGIVQGTLPLGLGAIILLKFEILKVLGRKPTPLSRNLK